MPSHRLLSCKVTEKPWGSEVLVDCNGTYALKEILMRAGTRSSLQSHNYKFETILVLAGEIELETVDKNGDHHFEIFSAGEAYHIPVGVIHRVKVQSDCRLVEVSTPHLDDIIRHEDDFGRETPNFESDTTKALASDK